MKGVVAEPPAHPHEKRWRLAPSLLGCKFKYGTVLRVLPKEPLFHFWEDDLHSGD